MEIRVYKNGETKRIELRDTAAKFDQQYLDVNEFKDVRVSRLGSKVLITVSGERFVKTDYDNYKDFSGGSLGSSASEVVNKIKSILSSRKEVDSFIVGDDLSQKSSETIFTHNNTVDGTEGLGGRVVLDNDEAKLDITRSTGQGETSVTVSDEDISG